MQTNPKYTITRWPSDCKLISVLIDHARELRGETGPYPDNHDGWEHEMFAVQDPTVGPMPEVAQRVAMADWRAAQTWIRLGMFPTYHDACEAAKAIILQNLQRNADGSLATSTPTIPDTEPKTQVLMEGQT